MTPPAAGAAAAAPAIHPRRTTGPRRAPATRRPRRVSGPAGPARTPGRRAPARSAGARPQARVWTGPLHALGLAEAVATHRLLDRLIRGRMWIGVIAFALIGIVTMQLVLLKLNAGIGRSLVREALLQRENATLSAENSEAGAGEQIEAQAARDGMEPVPAGGLRFLTAHPASDVSKAAAALSAPISTTASGEGSAPSTPSAAEAATTQSGVSGGEATTTPSPTSSGEATTTTATATPAASTETTPAASTETPSVTSAETPASNATSTATPTSGASEAAASTATPSASTSAAGGTPGG